MSAEERAAASRVAQGLPPKVTDPAVLDRVATLLLAAPVQDDEVSQVGRP